MITNTKRQHRLLDVGRLCIRHKEVAYVELYVISSSRDLLVLIGAQKRAHRGNSYGL